MLMFIKSLRFRLLLLVLIAIIPAMAISLWSGLEQRRLAQLRAVDDAYRYTRLVANYHSTLVQATESLMGFMISENWAQDPLRCSEFLARASAQYPMYTSFGIADRNGDIYCSAPQITAPINVADRDYFQDVLRTGEFVSGQSITSRLTETTILPFAMPVWQENNEVQAVLIAALEIQQLLAFAIQIDLPPESAILVVDEHGTVITRYPEITNLTGQSLQNTPIVQEILASGGEGSAETIGVDGTPRLYAFTPLTTTGSQNLSVSIGIPASIAYANADQLLRANLIWIGLASFLAMALAWFGGDILFLRVVSLTAERDRAEQSLRDANANLEERVALRTEELAMANEQLQRELTERQRVVELLRQRELELRRVLSQVERSNRDLQDFAYITSHDLQEPLRKIQAFSERLESRYTDALGEDGKSYLFRISSSAERMQAMINALLSYSRVNSKGQPFEPTNLMVVVEGVIMDLELRLQETGGRVLVQDLPTLDADPIQVRQLFQNLISNALKFRKPGVHPVVKISGQIIEASDNSNTANLVISIEDNGIGFENKYIDKIFQPFQRLHSREVYEGSGIGLAICRKIVERHNGTITVNSVPEQGSCFIVTLPITQQGKDERVSQ